jgi:hypothetical protein
MPCARPRPSSLVQRAVQRRLELPAAERRHAERARVDLREAARRVGLVDTGGIFGNALAELTRRQSPGRSGARACIVVVRLALDESRGRCRSRSGRWCRGRCARRAISSPYVSAAIGVVVDGEQRAEQRVGVAGAHELHGVAQRRPSSAPPASWSTAPRCTQTPWCAPTARRRLGLPAFKRAKNVRARRLGRVVGVQPLVEADAHAVPLRVERLHQAAGASNETASCSFSSTAAGGVRRELRRAQCGARRHDWRSRAVAPRTRWRTRAAPASRRTRAESAPACGAQVGAGGRGPTTARARASSGAPLGVDDGAGLAAALDAHLDRARRAPSRASCAARARASAPCRRRRTRGRARRRRRAPPRGRCADAGTADVGLPQQRVGGGGERRRATARRAGRLRRRLVVVDDVVARRARDAVVVLRERAVAARLLDRPPKSCATPCWLPSRRCPSRRARAPMHYRRCARATRRRASPP